MKTSVSLYASIVISFLLLGCHDDGELSPDAPVAVDPPIFGTITTGKIVQYHDQDGLRQDLSGAAVGEHVVFVDDGGSPSDLSGVLIGSVSEDPPETQLFTELHRDLEGATFGNGYYVATTSLSDSTDIAYRRLTRFRIDAANQIVEAESVDIRDVLMEGLRVEFGDAWYDRIKDEPAKSGGLNIEGISRTEEDGQELVWGLRSPLSGEDFGNPDTDPTTTLERGLAIVAVVDDAFAATPMFRFATLDLGGHGIRGIEWIPAMGAYVLIGGPVPKADGYTLWTWLGPDRGALRA